MKRINLLPPEYGRRSGGLAKSPMTRRLGIGATALFVLLLIHYLSGWVRLAGVRGEVQAFQRQIEEAQTVSESILKSKATLQSQLDHLEKRMSLLDQKHDRLSFLQGSQFKWSKALLTFHQAIPEKVWIDELLMEYPKGRIRGGTFGNQQVSEFIERLNRADSFANAAFARTETGTLNEQPVINFELAFELVRKS